MTTRGHESSSLRLARTRYRHKGSDMDILVEMDFADGNLLMRAAGLMEETRTLFDRDDIDIFPVQLLKRSISDSALADAVAL